ncbi:hypothetical protein OF83DRAFT_1172807 [Amylostereum chailletii]|nr:hypothetical protein OF83DRAFT_1172807 [Amylostereum chailletii]
MGIPILLNIGRVVNSTIYLTNYARSVHELQKGGTGIVGGAGSILITSKLPSVKIEWFVQIFDDVYLSGLFLSRFYGHGSIIRSQSFSEKIYTLFWISASNFVFPVLLSITQVVIYMVKPDDYLLSLYIQEVNLQFSIISVVFATAWAFEGRWAEEHGIRGISGHDITVSSLHFNTRLRGLSTHREDVVVFDRLMDVTPALHSSSHESMTASRGPVSSFKALTVELRL